MPSLTGNAVGRLTEIVQTNPIEEQFFGFGDDPDSRQKDFAYYRRVGGSSPVDLAPYTQERMQKIALLLYRQNPYAHRIVTLKADFLAAGAIRFEAEDPRVFKVLDHHWHHPLNSWDRRFHQCMLELGLYGEVFLVANVIEKLGEVTWGHIDPMRIRNVFPDDRDFSRAGLVELNADPGRPAGQTIKLKVIDYDGAPGSKTHGYRVGEVLFYPVNQVRGGLRGMSDLFPLADYLDGIDQFMFALQQRVSHQNNWIWDVTLEGMSQTDIDRWLASRHGKPPRPGTIRAHNERVQWNALAPEFAAAESADHIRMFRSYVFGGAGLADWVLGDMSSANRAATESSAAVIAKTMERRQRDAENFLRSIFDFVIDQKILNGSLPKRRLDRRFYINLPKVGIRDMQRVANAFRQFSEGIKTLMEAGLVDEERARRVAEEFLNQLDVEATEKYHHPEGTDANTDIR